MSRRQLPALPRRRRTAAAVVAAVLAGGALFGTGQATAGHATPVTDREIPNLTRVKEKIERYYGDVETADGEHYASPDSNYAEQVRGILAGAKKDIGRELAERATGHAGHSAGHSGRGKGDDGDNDALEDGDGKRPAIVLDIDDTTLLTYNFEKQTGHSFSRKAQDEYLRTTDMDPVFGMTKLVDWAHGEGVEVFFLTGRKEHQRAWSARNLKSAGYEVPVDKEHFYLKDEKNPPPYLECGSDCTTVEYKSGTRRHIEDGGYEIIAAFGDQYSDLRGGHTERTYKLPNPMYYLP